MKSLLIKWHFFWYRHHLKWSCVYTGIQNKKAEHHFCKFLDHNKYLCKHAPEVITAYQVKSFPEA